MTESKKDAKGLSAVVVVLVLLIVILVGVIGFMLHEHNNKATPDTTTSTSTTAVAPTQTTNGNSVLAAINAILNQGNYSQLPVYMATSVKVVKEGTDAGGTYYSSSAAAATISAYYGKTENSDGAELPWDFTGDSDYKSMAEKSTGAVKAYITQGNIAVSKNNWVLGYNLNSDQKISSFYMSPSVNLSK